MKKYINGFWNLNDVHAFSPQETWLYFYLLNQWLEDGQNEWFVPKLLPKLLPKMLLKRCRDKLVKNGLVEYQKGDRRSNSPAYKICCVTNRVTKNVTKSVTNKKEKVSPIPPLKEKTEREKENISKDIEKKEDKLSFCLPSYIPIMEEWIAYKHERKQTYTERGIRMCYTNLLKLSNNSPDIARLIVEQSIANNWAGLFELKNEKSSKIIRTATQSGITSETDTNQIGGLSIIEL